MKSRYAYICMKKIREKFAIPPKSKLGLASNVRLVNFFCKKLLLYMTRFRRQTEHISEPSCANFECLEIKVKSRSVVCI